MKSAGKDDKKKKKKNKAAVDEDFDEPPVDLASKAPKEMTAEELADEEWGAPTPKKGKKAKGKQAKASVSKDDEPANDQGMPCCFSVSNYVIKLTYNKPNHPPLLLNLPPLL